MWYENRQTGIWPRAGGWLDQPLSLLTQIKAIDLLVSTKTYLMSKESNWGKLTRLQADLIRWLGRSDG